MKQLKDFLFEEILEEKVISIGFHPGHDKYREHHRQEMFDILRNSYKNLGGYGGAGHGTDKEAEWIHHDITHHNIKATKRDGRITSLTMYKDMHGRKSVASVTDGTKQGKEDWLRNSHEDIKHKRSWGEVSGPVEHLRRKMGAPVIPSHQVKHLLGKDITPHENGEHYDRLIGDHSHTKVALGFPKLG